MKLLLSCFFSCVFGVSVTAWADYTWEGLPSGYGLTWSDEFNGTLGSAPNSANWIYDTGNNSGWGNGELENYTTSTANSQIVADPNAVDGSSLAIIVLDPGGNNFQVNDYTSARLESSGKQFFTYGYMEARIKMPYGQGIWPAFWMLGTDIGSVGWPACGENDIMENEGRSSDQSTNHGSLHDGTDFTNTFNLPGGQLFHNAYHTFSTLWQANEIQFYVDGNLYETQSSGGAPWAFNNSFFFLLNCAVGGSTSAFTEGPPNSGTSFPQTLYVDYVRVYQNGQPTPTPVVPTNGIWRVHCGGDNYTDSQGNLWAADTNFTGGWPTASGNSISGNVQPTAADQALYQYQRYGTVTGGVTVTYAFNVPTGTNYQVTLKFAETTWSAAGKRQFNYSINGSTEATNFDVYAAAGGANTAVDEIYNNVSPNSNGQIVIQLTEGSADAPTVGAIQVVPMVDARPTPTPAPVLATTPWLWPNPYYGSGLVTIFMPLTVASDVHVSLFTVAFRKVADIAFSQQPAGLQQLTFSAVDKNQTALANGLYYVRVVSSAGQQILKLLILR